MKKRLLSALIMITISLLAFYLGGIVLEIFLGVVAIAAYREAVDANKEMKIPNIMKLTALLALIALIYDSIDTRSIVLGVNYSSLCFVFLLLLIPTIMFHKYSYGTKEGFYLASITMFIGLVFNLFLTLHKISNLLIYYLLLIPIITDTFAYFGGRLLGKHKFTKISPNKTIEGCIIGSIFGVLAGVIFYLNVFEPIPVIKIIIVSLILSIAGQLGDLFFSLVKRECGIKDFSNLIPGHGGVLDRIDSYTFVIITFTFIYQFL